MIKNILKIVYKYRLIVILSFVVVLMTIIKINSSYQDQNLNSNQIITTIIVPTASPTIFIDQPNPTDEDPDYPLNSLLPYETNDFIIEEYVKPLTLLVKSKNDNLLLSKQKLREWLDKNELIPGENKIVWEE